MKRYLAILLLGLVLLAAAAVVWASAGRFEFGQAVTQLATAPSLDSPGANVALQTYTPAQREATLDAITAAGFGWIRQRFPWSEIEVQQGEFNWQPWDEIIDAAVARDLEVVAVLDSSPDWARSPEDAANPLAPPASRADFGSFAAAFARRYGDRLRFYQVWDEPNIAPHWGSRPVDAADYTGLLREAAVQ
ncbi:MAG: beta-galactosidase, partial [Anaerolineae bacterium]|nr:beta-galactosidase [Anaerolineae bacterium]